VPTSLLVINLPDIVRFIKKMAVKKIICDALQNAMPFKRKTIVYNKFRSLSGVAKKNMVLQNVMPCGRMGGKKIRPFYKDRISACLRSYIDPVSRFLSSRTVIAPLWIEKK
jgi:hypothetical protein